MVLGLQTANALLSKAVGAKGGSRRRHTRRVRGGSATSSVSSVMHSLTKGTPVPTQKAGGILPTIPKITIGGGRLSRSHKKSLKSLSKKLRKISATASKAASAAQNASKAKAASQSLSRAMSQAKSLQAQAQAGMQQALAVGRSIGRV
jgi:hypothetical protein